jgi:hypothetical protein
MSEDEEQEGNETEGPIEDLDVPDESGEDVGGGRTPGPDPIPIPYPN